MSSELFRLEAWITALPELPNRRRGAHWSRISASNQEWGWRVRAALPIQRPAVPLQRARVTLTRYSTVAPDPDNLAASWKPVLDALVRLRVLEDDNPGVVELVSRWEKGRRSIRIQVEALEDTP